MHAPTPLVDPATILSYDDFYTVTNAACAYPHDWFSLEHNSPGDQEQLCMPARTLKWERGKGFKAPKMCTTCHIPKYEGIKNGPPEKQVKKHICVFQPCKSLTSCLSHRYRECVAHSQELLSCKQKLKDAEEVERQAAAEMARWEAVQRNQEKAEHRLDRGKIQALSHSMGEDAMREIFNDSLSESRMKYAKRKRGAFVDLTSEDNPMLPSKITESLKAKLVKQAADDDEFESSPAGFLSALASNTSAASRRLVSSLTMGEVQDRLQALRIEKRELIARREELLRQCATKDVEVEVLADCAELVRRGQLPQYLLDTLMATLACPQPTPPCPPVDNDVLLPIPGVSDK